MLGWTVKTKCGFGHNICELTEFTKVSVLGPTPIHQPETHFCRMWVYGRWWRIGRIQTNSPITPVINKLWRLYGHRDQGKEKWVTRLKILAIDSFEEWSARYAFYIFAILAINQMFKKCLKSFHGTGFISQAKQTLSINIWLAVHQHWVYECTYWTPDTVHRWLIRLLTRENANHCRHLQQTLL